MKPIYILGDHHGDYEAVFGCDTLIAELQAERLTHEKLFRLVKPKTWYLGHFHELAEKPYLGCRTRILDCNELILHMAILHREHVIASFGASSCGPVEITAPGRVAENEGHGSGGLLMPPAARDTQIPSQRARLGRREGAFPLCFSALKSSHSKLSSGALKHHNPNRYP